MTVESLDIWLGGQRAGVLHRAGDSLSFVYDAGYIRSPGATPLSLSLPLNRVSHHPDTVSAFFQALLPEPGPPLARLELSAGVLRSDVLGLLTHVGRDLPGAIQALPSGFEPDEHGDATMLTGDDLAERVHQLRIESASGGRVLAEHGQWSLAGAQMKLALAYHDGQWSIPHGSLPTSHILKPAVTGFEHFDAYEVICLRAARLVGLSAAHAWLQPLSDGSHVAVVERYDRLRAPDGTVTRVHQEDLGQSLGVVATRKYEREGAPGLRRVAALLGQLPVEHRAASMQGVFEALAFNYAIAGTDGHLRNFSLLLSAESATLAPLYDLNTALPYTRPHGKRFDSVRKLHSSFILGSTDAFTRVTDDDWAAVGSLFGLERDAALARVHGLAQAVGPALESAARQVAKESGLSVNVDWSSLVRDYHAACAALSDRG